LFVARAIHAAVHYGASPRGGRRFVAVRESSLSDSADEISQRRMMFATSPDRHSDIV
jgi:hypothetical protein